MVAQVVLLLEQLTGSTMFVPFFNELVTKTAQFLSTKNDKNQFFFEPVNSSFNDVESVSFVSETYNDIYEKVYGNNINLKVSNSAKGVSTFDFLNSEFKSDFKIPQLSPGIYNYTANTQLGNKKFVDNGQFIITDFNPEVVNLTANHQMLKTIATQSQGSFGTLDKIESIVDEIKNRDFKPIIRSNDTYSPLVKNIWYLLLILMLLSSEWLLRKYWGGY